MELRVRLIRSTIGSKPGQRKVLKALGLTRTGKERVLREGRCVRGMLAKVAHLVEVEEVRCDAP